MSLHDTGHGLEFTDGRIDVRLEDHGTIFLFHPLTVDAHEWLLENVSDDAIYWGDALVVEHRYARQLAEGMKRGGLHVVSAMTDPEGR